MELGEWIGVRIIENSDNRGSTVLPTPIPTDYAKHSRLICVKYNGYFSAA